LYGRALNPSLEPEDDRPRRALSPVGDWRVLTQFHWGAHAVAGFGAALVLMAALLAPQPAEGSRPAPSVAMVGFADGDLSEAAFRRLTVADPGAARIALGLYPFPGQEDRAASTAALFRGMTAPLAAVPTLSFPGMTQDDARRLNEAIPFSAMPNPAAQPFRIGLVSFMDEARAVDCLTAAVYYEAGFESLEGQRAVAQVVLNRVRNPAFPKTVCGVVFQGANRKTGCQFSFTCDGSLGRTPNQAVWTRARAVAAAALNGMVSAAVGNATHYHADYVAPYWSSHLVKLTKIGAHIFYRWTGGWGMPPAFRAAYLGEEPGVGLTPEGLEDPLFADGLPPTSEPPIVLASLEEARNLALAAPITMVDPDPEPAAAPAPRPAPAKAPAASDELVAAGPKWDAQ
jgi:hypothetical protein